MGDACFSFCGFDIMFLLNFHEVSMDVTEAKKGCNRYVFSGRTF